MRFGGQRGHKTHASPWPSCRLITWPSLPGERSVLLRLAPASGGLGRGHRDRGAELTTVAARLLFGLLAQLAGEVGEPVQCGVDADQGEIGLDDFQP